MGCGNVCVHGDFEGLYYIDKDYIDIYTSKEADDNGEYNSKLLSEMTMSDFDDFDYDEYLSMLRYEDFVSNFVCMIKQKFSSFFRHDRDYGTILENGLFKIKIVDNEWSYAIMLIQKDDDYGNLTNLQSKHYKNYLDGIKTILLDLFPSIGYYTGAWTSGIIKRGDFKED